MARIGYRRSSLPAVGLLIAVNALVFIATMVNYKLIFLLGLQPASFPERPWTIVTSLFAHAGLWHILANMITLYFFGSNLAKLVGKKGFLITYFLGGIVGNIFYIFLGLPFSTIIGASGAVFAIGGALAVMRPRLRVLVFPIPVPLQLWVAVIGGFIIISLLPQVAWQAHLGGLVYGLTTGYFFRRREHRRLSAWYHY